jgi:hypothetical protein
MHKGSDGPLVFCYDEGVRGDFVIAVSP